MLRSTWNVLPEVQPEAFVGDVRWITLAALVLGEDGGGGGFVEGSCRLWQCAPIADENAVF